MSETTKPSRDNDMDNEPMRQCDHGIAYNEECKLCDRLRREPALSGEESSTPCAGYAAESDAESAYKLAMMCLQSERYGNDMDYRDATDSVIAWAAPWKRHTVRS